MAGIDWSKLVSGLSGEFGNGVELALTAVVATILAAYLVFRAIRKYLRG